MTKSELLKILDKVDDDTDIKIAGDCNCNEIGTIISVNICYEEANGFNPMVLIDYEI